MLSHRGSACGFVDYVLVKPFVANTLYVAFKAYFGLALLCTYIAFKAFLQVMQRFLGRQQKIQIQYKVDKHVVNAIVTLCKRQF